MVVTDYIDVVTGGFSDVIDISGPLTRVVRASGVRNGLVTIFCPGSTGAVTAIEFEEGVIEDLKTAIERLVPSDTWYGHDRRWGDGNGFSHVRAALMKPSLSVPLVGGGLVLGTWQQVVFVDFDNRTRTRRLVVQIIGE